MSKHSVLEFFHTTNIKLRMKGDQTSTCNFTTMSMTFSMSYLILRFALFSYVLHGKYNICMHNNYLISNVKSQI